jgi:hypothetical protein
MEGYQEDMLVELKELGERVDKLHDFIGNRANIVDLPVEKLDLLMRQYHYMTMYEHVLRLRCGMEGISW